MNRIPHMRCEDPGALEAPKIDCLLSRWR